MREGLEPTSRSPASLRSPRGARQAAARPRVGFRVLVALACAAALAAAAGGCALVLGFDDTTLRDASEGGTTEGGVLDEAGNPVEGGTSRLTTKPAALIVRRGGTTSVTVELARGSDQTGAVTARLSDLPVGVTATTAAISPTASSGTLDLTASTNATLGSKIVKLTAEGTTLAPAQLPLLVADPPGALDVTFDADGLASDSAKGLGSTFFALGVQADQSIVAGGAGGAGGAQPVSGWIIRRFLPTGQPDATFNAAASIGIPADGELRAIAIAADGKIVCAGSSTQVAVPQPLLTLVRFLPTGKLDPAFQGGIVRLPAAEGPGGSIGLGLVVQPDGAIVVVGSRKDLIGNEAGVITRFKADGTRDATFNGGTTIAIAATRFVGVALENGAVIAGGSTTSGALPSYFLTRRTAQGGNDPTFGTAGSAAFGNTYRANGFARLADGSLAVVGDIQQNAMGYTAGITSVQGNAVFARAYANLPSAAFFGIGVQADGRIIAAGHTAVTNGEARIARILPDGNTDATFNDGGTVFIEPPGGVPNFDVTLFAAGVQADGRILAAGNRTTAGAVVYRLWP